MRNFGDGDGGIGTENIFSFEDNRLDNMEFEENIEEYVDELAKNLD